MKFWNMEVATGDDGAKLLDVSLFGEIDPGFFGDGVASKEIAAQLGAHADAKKITVRINSVGGDLFGGLAIYNLLRNHGAEVTAIVEGLAASAASIVAMAGRTVMGRGAMMMIHNPLTVTVGDANEHRQQADVLDKARDSLLAIYQAKTGKKPGELRKMLDATTWLTADEAKREGFADEIADKPLKARADGSSVIVNSVAFGHRNVPALILAMAQPPAKEETRMKITREAILAEAPDLLKALLDEGKKAGVEEGRAAGIAAERERLKAIDELPIAGCADLVLAAKYGDKPSDAPTLAMAVLKAGRQAGNDILAARERESAPVAGVKAVAPASAQSEEQRAIENMKRYAQQLNAARNGRK